MDNCTPQNCPLSSILKLEKGQEAAVEQKGEK